MTLSGKTLFITGATRGIGRAIALRAAADGANVAVLGKTGSPHPKLEGTVYTAAEAIESAGGKALPLVCDVRSEEQVRAAVDATVKRFGGIDCLVNNASAISLTLTEATEMKRFDLMQQVNTRGTFLCSRLCIPHLKASNNPHILAMSPPLNLKPEWFGAHLAYTLSKFGMSECILGLAHELKSVGIAANALWPKTAIATAAVKNLLGGDEAMKSCRKPEIIADAAHAILTRVAAEFTGNFCLDEEILRESGVEDLSGYAMTPGAALLPDLFVE